MFRSFCFWFLTLTAATTAAASTAFGLADVAEIARHEAARAYQPAPDDLAPALKNLGYDALRDVRHRPERALWRAQALPFEAQYFHRSGDHIAVRLHEIVDGRVRALPYDPSAWTFGRNTLDTRAYGDIGHAGFRIHYPLNGPAYKDELIAFLGASYFRALGRGQQYGLSARALAIDTVGAPAGRGEEFPRFKAFWIERPAPGASTLTLYALLDSPRATGAYRFVITPGDTTTVDVQQVVYLRAPVARLGIAPLTSMFLHGENQPAQPAQKPGGDFRPEVHDSDGLLLAADGEWLWRPLFNPSTPLSSSFGVRRLQGFGLMQRDRRFVSYEDDEAHYERRPSAWVEPLGDWGAGQVELLLLPTPDETHDNVVAYWVPAEQPASGQALRLGYRLHWQGNTQQQPPQAWVAQARRGHGWAQPAAGELQYMLDFEGPALQALPADAAIEAVATAGPGARVLEARAWRHTGGGAGTSASSGTWRMQLRVQRSDPHTPLELRAYLRRGPHALTETWAALVPAEKQP